MLCVDDDRSTLETIGGLVEREGYTVIKAESAEDGLKALVEHEFDIVLTDLVMPAYDGIAIAEAAKKSSDKTKVIILTGFKDMSAKAEAKNLGVELIFKPCEFAKLVNLLKNS